MRVAISRLILSSLSSSHSWKFSNLLFVHLKRKKNYLGSLPINLSADRDHPSCRMQRLCLSAFRDSRCEFLLLRLMFAKPVGKKNTGWLEQLWLVFSTRASCQQLLAKVFWSGKNQRPQFRQTISRKRKPPEHLWNQDRRDLRYRDK